MIVFKVLFHLTAGILTGGLWWIAMAIYYFVKH